MPVGSRLASSVAQCATAGPAAPPTSRLSGQLLCSVATLSDDRSTIIRSHEEVQRPVMDQLFRFMRMDLSSFETIAVWAVLGIAVIGLIYAVYLRRQNLAEDKGTARMIEVWEAIRQGANATCAGSCAPFYPLSLS